jgi:hypothetical protein
MEEKFLEFGNYLLSINKDETKKLYIYGSIINNPNKSFLVNVLRVQDDTEDKTVVELDENNVEKTVVKYSQVMEFINILGLENTEEVKIKLLEYLNDLLQYKNSL